MLSKLQQISMLKHEIITLMLLKMSENQNNNVKELKREASEIVICRVIDWLACD